MQYQTLGLFVLILFLIMSCNKDDDGDLMDDPPITDTTTNPIDTIPGMNDTISEPMDTLPNTMDTLPLISLTISNIEDIEGELFIALYNSKEDWDTDIKDTDATGNENAYDFAVPTVESDPQVVVFQNVAIGTYAFSVFQDVNSNGEMDKIAGILPDEPYGFSQNASPSISGAPDFEDCAFTVGENEMVELEIVLQ